MAAALAAAALLRPMPAAAQLAAGGDPPLPGVAAVDRGLASELEAAWRAKGAKYEPRTRHVTADGTPKFTNRLIRETSPYLLQHAHNPVNWHAWGDEPFERARRENKPVFLSVGYSTCHWCHVMEHESFEDEEIAAFLNEHFVAIKVDREERPDVDDVYMQAVQMMTSSGGWPMNVMLTPDRRPFFGGTYFPARDGDRGMRKGLLTILRELAALYQSDPGKVADRAEMVSRRIQSEAKQQPSGDIPGGEAIYLAASRLARGFDAANGGFGGAPKFPRPSTYELLLHYFRRTNDAQALHMVTTSLEKMAAGGVYDHVGGGFHRYAVDVGWRVPHFEKMLYDNAQLSALYLDAFQLTGREDFARVATETLDYVAREMTSLDGAFFSATDADSATASGELEEGAFFTWTPAEVDAAVGSERARLVREAYGVTEAGNLDGRSVLYAARPLEDVARAVALAPDRVRTELAEARKALYEARAKRPAPLRDDKILASWNGLMISSFARGAFVLARTDYAERARRAADFVLARMRDRHGRLLRSHNDGRARHAATLDDYAFVVQGLLDLYEATWELRWLEAAIALQRELDERFYDDESGGYFLTAHDAEKLIVRRKPDYDGAEPSGNSVAAMNLLRLEQLTLDEAYRRRAEGVLRAFAGRLQDGSLGLPKMLAALDFYTDEPREVLVVAAADDSATRKELLASARRVYLPNRAFTVLAEGAELERHARVIPWLEGKHPIDGRTTAFVCKKGTCLLPTSKPETFARQLLTVEPLIDGESPPPLPPVLGAFGAPQPGPP